MKSLSQAIDLILADRWQDALQDSPENDRLVALAVEGSAAPCFGISAARAGKPGF